MLILDIAVDKFLLPTRRALFPFPIGLSCFSICRLVNLWSLACALLKSEEKIYKVKQFLMSLKTKIQMGLHL